MFNVIIQ